MEKSAMLDAVYGISQAWSSVIPVMLVRPWRKLLPYEEIRKSEILDMARAMRSFESIDEDNVEQWLQSDACELGIQYMTGTDAAKKQKKWRVGRSSE
jgi:hypothetical protein